MLLGFQMADGKGYADLNGEIYQEARNEWQDGPWGLRL